MKKTYSSISEIVSDLDHDCKIYDEIIDALDCYQKTISELNEDADLVEKLVQEGSKECLEQAELYLKHRADTFLERLDLMARNACQTTEK